MFLSDASTRPDPSYRGFEFAANPPPWIQKKTGSFLLELTAFAGVNTSRNRQSSDVLSGTAVSSWLPTGMQILPY